MGLATALSTALTGLTAAEAQIDVIGNNIANSQTVGFKSSRVVFASQFAQTLSLGSSPTEDNGGANPRQIGRGTQVAQISPNLNQGTIEISSSASDLAIQGDGFFIVEGAGDERFYTRNGLFQLNEAKELTNSTGQRLLGFGVDDQFRIEQGDLRPVTIPLGTEAVARATQSVTLEGGLTPDGDIADTSEVIESAILGDAAVPRADATGVNIAPAPLTDASAITATLGNGALSAGNYQYRVALVDSTGNESTPSGTIDVAVGPAGRVQLDNLPTAPSDSGYQSVNVYRTTAGGSDFFPIGTAALGGSFVDDGTASLGPTPLNDARLTGNYTYVVTYHRTGSIESRPSTALGPINVVNGRITLNDLPQPPSPGPEGEFPAYDQVRIYRNLASDQNNFYLVDTLQPGDTFTDSRSDAEISDLATFGNQLLNREGPTVTSNTLLTNVIKRDGNRYESLFPEGTLTFTGRKGGRSIGDYSFDIQSTSTVQDLLDFVQEASGIQTTQVDSANPIPASQNLIPGETGDLVPGGSIQNGRLRLVSNTGELNALELDLSSFRVEEESGNIVTPNLAFGSVQEARGISAATDFVVYDTLGLPLNVRVTATLESRDSEETVYRWYADSPDNDSAVGSPSAVGTGLVRFDGNGNFVATTSDRVAIQREDTPSVSPLEFRLDFSTVSGLATPAATLAATRQDGSEPGVLNSFQIGEDGIVRGIFSNGITRDLGQVRLARFTNAAGLENRGLNLFAEGVNSGLAITGAPNENGIGTVIGGALELSNTDVGQDLVDLVLASTQYRGNSRVITTSQQLLDELLNLRR